MATVGAPSFSPSASSTAIGVLTFTPSVPSEISSFDTRPSSTASTSMVALSVSISAMMSPGLTVWPSLTSHLASLPSSMVGESAGIRISVGILLLFGVGWVNPGASRGRPNTSRMVLLCWVIADARPNLRFHLYSISVGVHLDLRRAMRCSGVSAS